MTNTASGDRSRTNRLTVPQRIMLFTAVLAAVAAALFVIVVRPLPGAPTALTLPWVFWAAAFAISEALPVHVQIKRDAHTFSVSDLVMAAGLVLTTPGDLVVAQVVGVAVALVLHRRQRGGTAHRSGRGQRDSRYGPLYELASSETGITCVNHFCFPCAVYWPMPFVDDTSTLG